jgi:sugar phosphate isomerase/epimerase
MFLAYNTNGFAHHKLEDAVRIIAGCGYQGVALTPDVHHLNPFDPDLPGRTAELRELLESLNLRCVIETGARFLLDAHRKHQPTLISPNPEDRQYRYEFLALDGVGLAKELGAECLSFWSGTATDDAPPSVLMDRLVEQCQRLADHAAGQGVQLAFEPEPGMLIDTMDRFAELHGRVNHPAFGLTLDIGHLVCQSETPIGQHVRQWGKVLQNVHIEDMKRGVHDHLMFGEGEVDFSDFFRAVEEIQFRGCISVELSRHSHDAVNTARKSRAFLTQWLDLA